RSRDTLEGNLASELAGLDDLGIANCLANHTSLLENLDVDFVDGQALKVGQAHVCVEMLSERSEATLGQTALQRHLTAFEPDLVEAPGTGLLTLVTTTRGLTQAGADTAADT